MYTAVTLKSLPILFKLKHAVPCHPQHYLLAQVFSIPESVVLPEDRCQLLRQSEEETDQMERRKIELKKEILAVSFKIIFH